MFLMDFLRKIFIKPPKKSFTKNYLRIYGNIDKISYSDKEKEVLIETFQSIATDLFERPKLKFDISGVGYGISKGGSLLGVRAFTNRLSKVGLSKLEGIYVKVEEANYHSLFSIMTNEYQILKRVDIEFTWLYKGEESLNLANDLLKKMDDIVSIEYAYCYPDDETLSEYAERRVKTTPFSITSYTPKAELPWESSMHQIKDGKIKKIYPINVFNEPQKAALAPIKHRMKVEKLNNSIEIWKTPTIQTEIKAENAIII